MSRCRGGEPGGTAADRPHTTHGPAKRACPTEEAGGIAADRPHATQGPAKRACPAGVPEVELMNSRDTRRALSIQLGALVIVKTVGASVGILGAWWRGVGGDSSDYLQVWGFTRPWLSLDPSPTPSVPTSFLPEVPINQTDSLSVAIERVVYLPRGATGET